jgi:hypothetical protein
MKILNFLLNLLYVNSQMITNTCINCINRQIIGENIDCFNECNEMNNNCDLYTICDTDKILIKYNDICYCENYINCNEYFCTQISEVNTDSKLISYTTYELSLLLKDNAKNIYILYGDIINNMIIPEAFQTNLLAGVDIGGINNILLKRYDESKYDSWLTIQIDDGDIMGRLSTIGIDYSLWDIYNPLIIDNGAIFIDEPLSQLSNNNKYLIAHLTLSDFDSHQVIFNIQGKTDISLESAQNTNINNNFRVSNITFNIKKKKYIDDSH